MTKLSKIETVTVNQGRVMDADTIPKNGQNSKSQISKGIFLKKMSFSLLVIGIVICGLFFTSCGGTPSSIVKKAMNAVMKKDADKYFEYAYYLDTYDKQIFIQRVVDSESRLEKFEIQDERIFSNGEKAKVFVKVFYESGNVGTDIIVLDKFSSGWKIVEDKSRGILYYP